MVSDEVRDSALATFSSLAPDLIKETQRTNTDGTLRHPSSVVLSWDFEQVTLFEGRLTEIVCIDGVRLWAPVDHPNDNWLPFVWMMKANRMCVETMASQPCSPLILVLDVNEMLDEEIRSKSEEQCLAAVNQIKDRGVKEWVAECLGAIRQDRHGTATGRQTHG
jgi:hypothetical protein